MKMLMILGVIKDMEMRKIMLAMDRHGICNKQNRVSLENSYVYTKSMDFMKG